MTDHLLTRQGLFVVSYQVEGLCVALRLMVQSGNPAGPETRQLLRRLMSTFRSLVTSGPALEGIPEISDTTAAADLLSIAETLRTTALCFLTPEEHEERKRSIGFTSL